MYEHLPPKIQVTAVQVSDGEWQQNWGILFEQIVGASWSTEYAYIKTMGFLRA